MPFPISMSGEAGARQISAELAIDRLETALRTAKAWELSRGLRSIRFRGGLFRLVSSWNILVPVSEGVLEISTEGDGVKVRYQVRFTQMLVTTTLMIALLMGPAVAMATPKMSLPEAVGILLVGWLWLFGGNVGLWCWRWPRFLVRSLSPRRET